MSEYKHGAYGRFQAAGSRVAAKSENAIVYIGTAPVHTLAGGGANVNKPVLVENIAQARALFGYSDDFDSFTLCEAMKVHFEQQGVGPLVFINVFNPSTHKETSGASKTLTPSGGRIVIADAQLCVLDSITVTNEDEEELTPGVDYTTAYNAEKKTVTISEVSAGSLGTDALTVEYDIAKPAAVTNADVIGSTDGQGLNTGIYAIANVYQATGYIPSMMLVPKFSAQTAVHAAMIANSSKVNGHWDVYMLVDMPLVSASSTPITLNTAATWKEENGYNRENETVYFPMVKGTDGLKYHISVLAAANFQKLLLTQNGIPYKTASNTEASIIENLYLGDDVTGRAYDDTLINEKLNKNGIASAAYVGGRWVIWGCHSADYNQNNADFVNVSETSRMMLYYISNDFQHRRTRDVDKPLSSNDIKTIVSEEQTRLDALVKIGALTFGEVSLNADNFYKSDIVSGDHAFTFEVTTTPLAKSLTAIVNWTDEGFVTYFENYGE